MYEINGQTTGKIFWRCSKVRSNSYLGVVRCENGEILCKSELYVVDILKIKDGKNIILVDDG